MGLSVWRFFAYKVWKEWYLVICRKRQKVATRDYSVLVGITVFNFTENKYLCAIIMKVLALLMIEHETPFPHIFIYIA
jgi:hypothetical protein